MSKRFKSLTAFLGKITVKIWLASVAVGLAAIVLVFLMTQVLFNSYFLDTSLSLHAQAATSAVESTDEAMDYILNRLISVCARTADFRNLLRRVHDDTGSTDIRLNNDLQQDLNDLCVSHPLVKSALLIAPDGRAYYPVTRVLDAGSISFTMGYDPALFSGITMLPVQRSPFKADGQVMPMAVPLCFFMGDSMIAIADDAASADVMLYLFLDAASLNATLNLYTGSGVNLLVSPGGQVLNYPAGSPEALLAEDVGVTQALTSWDQEPASVRLGSWYALPQAVDQHHMYLVHLVSYSELTTSQREIAQGLVVVAIWALVIISLAALFSAVFLTRPIKQVNRAVKAIEQGHYDSSMCLHQQDEIGALSASVDSMYHTMQAQMDQIRHERQQKDSLEIRLIAEQINPHFLYNTLEYINMEVYNSHTRNASMMIQSLGEFLRIGLNFGREEIPLQREVEHVQSYIAIMNHRFSQEIGFTTDIPENLLQERVVKIILQPLVENSIRHGFMMESSDSFIEIPTIRLRCSVADGFLILQVSDNGTGFDVENTRRIMHEDPSLQKHVGLSNVYHRLRLHYGDAADIELQSIPYYKNTVTIRIPFRDASERSDP